MNESGPVRKTRKDLNPVSVFSDYVQIASDVWRATLDGKHWLLKTAGGGDTDSLQRLRREYELSCNLQHPFVVRVERFEDSTEVGPAIVMEYIEGRPLRDYVAEGPSVAERRKVLGQILDAVGYIHACGVLHNDIKPENIMVSAIGNDAKIIDFGFGENDADFLNRKLGGTEGASAPEVLRGDSSSRTTAASDIYSLGGVISLLFPRRYRCVVSRCRRNNPERRYPDVHALRAALTREDRIPLAVAGIFLVLALFAPSFIPGIIDRRLVARETVTVEAALSADRADTAVAGGEVPDKSEDGSVAVPERPKAVVKSTRTNVTVASDDAVAKVKRDMEAFHRDAADRLSDRARVPYREFAFQVRSDFVNRTLEYRNTLPDGLLPTYYSEYERYLVDLNTILLAIPWLSDARDSGKIPQDEYMRLLNLANADKPYSPPEP